MSIQPGGEVWEDRRRLKAAVGHALQLLGDGATADAAEVEGVDFKEEAGRRGRGGAVLAGRSRQTSHRGGRSPDASTAPWPLNLVSADSPGCRVTRQCLPERAARRISSGELAEMTGLTQQGALNMLTPMEGYGLVRRGTAARGRQAHFVSAEPLSG